MKILMIPLSGGLDSSTCLFKALNECKYDIIIPINFSYGQKNLVETKAVINMLSFLKKSYIPKLKEKHESNNSIPELKELFSIDVKNLLGDRYAELRDSSIVKEKTNTEFYTPFRNLLFATVAGMIGELHALNIENDNIESIDICIGVHKHSNVYEKDYWDITPSFIQKLNDLIKLNDNFEFGMFAPYQDDYKSKIIKDAISYNVPVELTWTCYDPILVSGIAKPCLECEACIERDKQGKSAGIENINDYEVVY